MIDTDPRQNGAGGYVRGLERVGLSDGPVDLDRTHEAPRGHRTPTERRNALEDTLGYAAQEADALADYYASVAKQLRLLARQVTFPALNTPNTPAADQYDEHGEHELHSGDR